MHLLISYLMFHHVDFFGGCQEQGYIEDIVILSGDHLYRMDYLNLLHRADTTLLGLSQEEAEESPYIASMGVSVFKRDILLKLLRWRYPTSNAFGSEILPAVVTEHNVQAYLFRDYWEDTGTIKSFYNTNLAVTNEIKNAIISHGCFLRECSIEHSIVGERLRIDSGVELKVHGSAQVGFWYTRRGQVGFWYTRRGRSIISNIVYKYLLLI